MGPQVDAPMETDKEGSSTAAQRKYYVDNTFIHVPREGVEMVSPMKDGMGTLHDGPPPPPPPPTPPPPPLRYFPDTLTNVVVGKATGLGTPTAYVGCYRIILLSFSCLDI